jgi:hypothetical protein
MKKSLNRVQLLHPVFCDGFDISSSTIDDNFMISILVALVIMAISSVVYVGALNSMGIIAKRRGWMQDWFDQAVLRWNQFRNVRLEWKNVRLFLSTRNSSYPDPV